MATYSVLYFSFYSERLIDLIFSAIILLIYYIAIFFTILIFSFLISFNILALTAQQIKIRCFVEYRLLLNVAWKINMHQVNHIRLMGYSFYVIIVIFVIIFVIVILNEAIIIIFFILINVLPMFLMIFYLCYSFYTK